ncbi:MarR family winged helix-turn-helix transcriptional regulator [Propionicicella superfundia]|uniref:MarR family winged helix-turn-helix transcriptional regulator n=1 Tax=Propionicicella superfundia TaxID=348582 RepID=UPI0012EBD62A|nr:MarR family winged helix-turn-helix transcriptional regulator [Propionicicella superfundia]
MNKPMRIDPDVADLADLVLNVARKITVRGHSDVDVIPLTPLESLVMRYVHQHPGTSPSRVAADVGLAASNMSAALRSLDAKGLVGRSTDPHDRRGVRLSPTPLADQNLERIRSEWTRLLMPVVGGRAELPEVNRLLRDLDRRLGVAAEAGDREPGPVAVERGSGA